MKKTGQLFRLVAVLAFITTAFAGCSPKEKAAEDPLPSFNEGQAKNAIITFVKNVTDPNSSAFVPEENRIACFDNDGTLWCEQPMPVQFYFTLDRIKALAESHPEWQKKQPFKAVIENDTTTFATFGVPELVQLLGAANAAENVEDFDGVVKNWISTARHPKFGKRYTDLVYQPMLEVVKYFQANGFKTYIVSGGSQEFMRAWAPEVYGIPKEQIIGTSLKTEVVAQGDTLSVKRTSEFEFNDDHKGKVINIDKFIGRKPIAVFGNSDGDLEMMEYAYSQPDPKLMVYVNHTDGQREYFYDEHTLLGKLQAGMEIAKKNNWTIIDMKNDWNTIFPAEKNKK